jgi:hypothetical protein
MSRKERNRIEIKNRRSNENEIHLVREESVNDRR